MAHITVPAIVPTSVVITDTLFGNKLKPVLTKWKIRYFRRPETPPETFIAWRNSIFFNLNLVWDSYRNQPLLF